MTESPYNPPNSLLEMGSTKKGILEKCALSFLRHWNGKGKLSTAFWGYFLFGNVLLKSTMWLLIFISSYFGLGKIAIFSISNLVIAIFAFVYWVCSLRILWKCAGNSFYSGFFYIVRGLIVLFIILLVSIFAITFYETMKTGFN